MAEEKKYYTVKDLIEELDGHMRIMQDFISAHMDGKVVRDGAPVDKIIKALKAGIEAETLCESFRVVVMPKMPNEAEDENVMPIIAHFNASEAAAHVFNLAVVDYMARNNIDLPF